VVVEVLSPSTRDYDLGDKRAYYEGTPSIRHILHVEPDRVEVQHHRRTPAGWATDTHTTLDAVLHLEGMDVTVAEIYAA
jgi:Uma2 family endonuclease